MKLEQAKFSAAILGIQTNAQDKATPEADTIQRYDIAFSDGTAANQAQLVWSDTRTLAATTNESLDLAGVLSHALGGTITFTAIKLILVVASAANTGNIRVGAGVANAFQGPFGASAIGCLVEPGGEFSVATVSAAGWAVTPGTGDLLRVENLSAASSDYDIYVLGEGTVA